MMIFTKAYFPVRMILTHYIEHFFIAVIFNLVVYKIVFYTCDKVFVCIIRIAI